MMLSKAAPSQLHNYQGKQTMQLQPLCTCKTILFITFSTVTNKLQEGINILL